MLLLRFWTCWCYKVEEIEARSMMEMFFHRKEKATVSYGKKNTHDTVAFFYITVSDREYPKVCVNLQTDVR